MEQFIKNRKGLGDMLDKYENDILDKKSDHDLQCCEYLIKFTCCKIDHGSLTNTIKSKVNEIDNYYSDSYCYCSCYPVR